MYLRINILSLSLIIYIIFSPFALAQSITPEKPDKYVIDLARIIDDATENRLNGYLQELKQKSGHPMAVFTIESREAIESTRSNIKEWRLGLNSKNNFVAQLLIVPRERRWKIYVNPSFEWVLPDNFVDGIGRDILEPYFGKGDYSGGIFVATLAMANRIADRYNVKIEGMPPMKYSTPFDKRRETDRKLSAAVKYIAVILVFIFGGIGRKNTIEKRKRKEELKKEQESKKAEKEHQRSEKFKRRQSEEFQRKEEERRRQENRRKSEEERRRAEEQNRRHSQSNFNESTVRDESYYASVLGFQGRVMPEDVKRRYKKLASQYHPDKVGHLGQKLKEVAEQEMKNINEAYGFFKKKYGFK